MRVLTLILASLLMSGFPVADQLATAQEPAAERPDPRNPEGENLKSPPGWKVRLDHPNPEVTVGWEKEKADIWFVNMTPGWHITTGPAAIFWHPASTARGDYRVSATIHLFDPGQHQREGYGLFFGGRELEGEGQSYGYFLLRNDGKFLIKKRTGAATQVVQGWTPHDAIGRYGPESGESEKNVLAVEVRGPAVHFFVNGQQVASHPRADLPTDGVVGLRVNHHLNVHVADLAVTPLEK